MILYPAIDIRAGRAVRLLRGDYSRETAYDADPLAAAERWAADGARWLHVVDLDGARDGEPRNLEHVRRIADALPGVRLQVGGGLRDHEALAAAFAAGAQRAVLGTAALRDRGFLDAALGRHGDRIVVGVDSRGGRAATDAWRQTSDRPAGAVLEELAAAGVGRFVFTPIDVDGTMGGPPLDELRAIADGLDAELVYSGGVGSLDDLRALAAANVPGLAGVIVGRALYEGAFSVAEACDVLADEG